ncbi:MAG: chromate resistance protein ChrB domain-containing protein [Vicinamibacterales bacterium]
MKWVTREHVKVDRVACPWLIRTFVDSEAELIFVPVEEVPQAVREQGAIPYDVAGVELGHHGDECSFDAILKRYGLTDPALERLARIVRGADTAAKDLTPESPGLEAIAEGFRRMAQAGGYDDLETNRREWIVYDALYLFCGGDPARIERN